MPAAFAHDLYGRMVYQDLSPKLRKLIRRERDCFYLGLHGPDILFFYYPLGDNAVVKKGYRLHEEPARDFFEAGIRRVRREKDKEARDAKKAYLLGFACHFALDSSLHGYINERDRDTAFSHSEIETELDRRLLLHEGKHPLRINRTGHLKNRERVRRAAGELLLESGRTMSCAIATMKLVNRLFVNSPEPVKEAICMFLRARGKYEEIHGMLMRKRPVCGCQKITDYLERQFFAAVPLGAALAEDLWDCMESGRPLSERFDRNFE